MKLSNQRFERDNAYGHCLTLLERLPGIGDSVDGAIHLDIACGAGALAEPLTAALGLTYVGVDPSQEAVDELRSRGFEAHRIDIEDREGLVATLREVIGDRPVASISCFDALPAMPTDQTVLTGIRDIAKECDAVVVVSVSNVTHADTGFKLAFGRWDVTESGLLGENALQQFDRNRFGATLREHGLYRFAELNVERERSDQHFPVDHPALLGATSLRQFLLAVRDEAKPDSLISQFVWLCTPGPLLGAEPRVEVVETAPRPFLSIITRTQGARPECLAEVLTSLTAQTVTDFEVLVMGHKLTPENRVAVERAIEDCPQWMRDRTRLIRVEHGRRAAPLNEGFGEARGHYIAILDDDDIPFGHWVESFQKLAARAPGRVLRTVSVIQDVQMAAVMGSPAVRAVGAIDKRYPSSFDFVDHLRMNYTPNTAVAFPRGAFHDLGIHFDETLTTTEDWDFILRTTSVVGVESGPDITCVYRWWTTDSSSRTDHAQDEWIRNQQAIERKFDVRPLLLPAGAVPRVRGLLAELEMLKVEKQTRQPEIREVFRPDQGVIDNVRADYELRLEMLREIQEILGSRSWKAAAPIRAVGRLRGRRPVQPAVYVHRTAEELRQVVADLKSSRSWRSTRLLRARH